MPDDLTRGEGHPVWRERCLGRGIGGAAEAGSDAESPLRKARNNEVATAYRAVGGGF